MRAIFVLLVVASTAAGCAMPGNGADDDPDDASTGVTFLPPVMLGDGGPEPVIFFSPEGDTLYVTAQDIDGGSPHVWASTDGGVSFRASRPNAEGGGEVDGAAGAGGLVYVTQLGTRGNVISISRDSGQTWQTSPLSGASQYFDREWLTVDADGRVFFVARQFGADTAAGVARSDDEGQTFPPRGQAWNGLNEPGAANGNMISVGTTVHLVYLCRDGNAVCVSTSSDGGSVWTQSLVVARSVTTANVYPVIGAVADGLVVVWADASTGTLAVWSAYSSDGRTWSAPVRVTPEGTTAALPWVTAREGTAWVVYLTTDGALAATDSSAAEQAVWRVSAQAIDARGKPSGAPLLVSSEPVHQGVISPPVGQTSGGARDRNFGDFFTATVGPDSRLFVATSRDDGTAASVVDVVIAQAP